MSTDRVLSLSLRPKSADECVGQDDMITLLENQFSSGRIPHFYIIHGPIGSGKTTIARILALALQKDPKLAEKRLYHTEEDWKMYKKYDIREINAANQNGIDDIRTMVEGMGYKPMAPSRARVVIYDEAHQITTAAQNTLLTETEDVANHVFYIFCTSNISKIIAALQRRAYIMTPRALAEGDIRTLLTKAATATHSVDDIEPLVRALIDNGITSPGLVLQAAEKFFGGMPPEESVFQNDITNLDTMAICRAVAGGKWPDAAKQLAPISKSDIMMVKMSVLGYLKAIMVKSPGQKAIHLAKAIRVIGNEDGNDNIPMFLANVCLGCECLYNGK